MGKAQRIWFGNLLAKVHLEYKEGYGRIILDNS
jgi:hypothetical protein